MAAFDFPASPTVGQRYDTGTGVVYVWDGVAWKGEGGSTPLTNSQRVIKYDTAGTFAYVKPANLKALQVEIFGAGGGSGGAAVTAATTVAAGGGGGGGGYVRKLFRADELAASENLVLGVGGAGGDGVAVHGSAGATSSFKSVSVNGGGGGSTGASSASVGFVNRGVAGYGVGGDFNGAGNSGQYGFRLPDALAGSAQAGYGGAGYGQAQYFNTYTTTRATSADISGANNNSGANGVANGFSQAVNLGVKGGDGYAVFTEYYYENDYVGDGYLPLSGGTLSGDLTVIKINHDQEAASSLFDVWRNEFGFNEYAWRMNGVDPRTLVLRRYDGLVSGAYRNILSLTPGTGVDATVALHNLTMQQGIAFPAAQVASADPNTIDDYEEGLFTPVVKGTTVAGTATVTFANGRYTKVGNRVHFDLTTTWSAHTGTGNMYISGMPFTSASSYGAIFSPYVSQITFTGQLTPFMGANSSDININSSITNAAAANNAVDAAGTISISGSYTVA